MGERVNPNPSRLPSPSPSLFLSLSVPPPSCPQSLLSLSLSHLPHALSLSLSCPSSDPPRLIPFPFPFPPSPHPGSAPLTRPLLSNHFIHLVPRRRRREVFVVRRDPTCEVAAVAERPKGLAGALSWQPNGRHLYCLSETGEEPPVLPRESSPSPPILPQFRLFLRGAGTAPFPCPFPPPVQ